MKRALSSGVVMMLALAACDPSSPAATTAPPDALLVGAAAPSDLCARPARHGPAANFVVTSLVGDKDGFGRGLTEGATLPASESFDASTAADPTFTDRWSTPPDFSYQHGFVLPRGQIVAAELELLTLGVQDGDAQVLGSDTDIRLYVNGIEVPQAFDTVDQFFRDGSAFVQQVGKVIVPLPACILPSLEGGTALVHIEILQLGTAPGTDAIGIDYAELRVSLRVPPGSLR